MRLNWAELYGEAIFAGMSHLYTFQKAGHNFVLLILSEIYVV